MTADSPRAQEAEALRDRLDREAERAGYHLNPDVDFTRDLARGLLTNQDRYGYLACPCRLASGDPDADRDIVCPCDYRDADLLEWGSCYCGLYVGDAVREGRTELAAIPERRPGPGERSRPAERPVGEIGESRSGILVWRCRVCGYLCARGRPPAVCPICKAAQDRFELFSL